MVTLSPRDGYPSNDALDDGEVLAINNQTRGQLGVSTIHRDASAGRPGRSKMRS